MLEAIRANLDGLSEQEVKHYIQKDGKYYLDVGPVDGTALENVTGLKQSLEKVRKEERQAKQELDALKAKVGDMDLVQAKEALAKYDEIKNFDADGKVKAAIEARTKELAAQHTKEKEALQTQLNMANAQLDEAVVTSKVVEALQQEGGNVELLRPHVMKSIRVKTGADGKRYPEVVGPDGEPRVGDGAGNPMTIRQRVAEMKSQETFAAAFTGTNSTGGGTGGTDDGKSRGASGSRIIKAGSGPVIVDDLESIASGKTTVQVSS